jgi:alginate O-acetyltransferase complex protein AlgI
MVFSSPIFLLLFLPIVILVNFTLKESLRNFFLLIASLFFYAWGEPLLVILMVFSIMVNYLLGILVDKYSGSKKAKIIIIVAIVTNIGMLIFYKYSNFIVDNLNILLDIIGVSPIFLESVSLPIGISFYTFQSLSYVIDVYRRNVEPQKNPLNLGLYIAFFPQLVAGPIVRYVDVVKQINFRKIVVNDLSIGINRFIIGLGKKVLIANPLGATVDQIFVLTSSDLTFGISWLGIVCYTLQIYFDFSGYSDMAIGLGRIFGFKFPENFNYPYISSSIREFWRRWHISLSTWFRDYLYIPMGGSRCKPYRVYINLLTVFLATGLWHGATWNFVIWGIFHGFFIMIERSSFGIMIKRMWLPIRHIYTLLIITIGWVFFRTGTLAHSISYLKSMFMLTKNSGKIYNFQMFLNNEMLLTLCLGIILSTSILTNLFNTLSDYMHRLKYLNSIVNFTIGGLRIIFIFSILILCTMSLATQTYNPFIYYRF